MSDLQAMEGRWKDACQQAEFYEAEAMKFEEFLKRANAKLAQAKGVIGQKASSLRGQAQAVDICARDLDEVDLGEVKEEPKVEATPQVETGDWSQDKEYGWSETEQKYGWWNKQGRDEEGRFQTFPQVAKAVDGQ